jgi:hypothetical protein
MQFVRGFRRWTPPRKSVLHDCHQRGHLVGFIDDRGFTGIVDANSNVSHINKCLRLAKKNLHLTIRRTAYVVPQVARLSCFAARLWVAGKPLSRPARQYRRHAARLFCGLNHIFEHGAPRILTCHFGMPC